MTDEWIAEEWQTYVEELGLALRQARKKSGLSQEILAGKAGVSTFTYQKLENGQSNPDTPANPRLRTLVAISRVLEVPLDELLPKQSYMRDTSI
ncbi:MAG: helix-turn-helix domain-containing protein [Coriobacteriia bacterium]|nr:helix-turn-helix domain-containing protein [Coriobacteriia bacterium]